MSVALLLISDGRDEYLERTRASIAEHLPSFDHVVEVDDREHRLGFAGAIQEGWEQVLASGVEWVWHAEQDFTYNERVPLDRMIGLLERHPELAQVALKRQPWNPEERAAGGIVELHPDDFTSQIDDEAVWTEHRRYFTTNPSLYRAELCRRGWPQEPQSEGLFTMRLIASDRLVRFAIWGDKFDRPLVTHIGEHRAGCGY